MTVESSTEVWEAIAREAAEESELWAAALRPHAEREAEPVFSELCDERFALSLETIYEGYLLHYGGPRLFAPGDGDTTVLLGDYLFAHGLVRLAALEDVAAVSDLAALISLCTQLRAEGAPIETDGLAWAATAALMGRRSPELERGRTALRLHRDPGPLRDLAAGMVGDLALGRALAAHRDRVQ